VVFVLSNYVGRFARINDQPSVKEDNRVTPRGQGQIMGHENKPMMRPTKQTVRNRPTVSGVKERCRLVCNHQVRSTDECRAKSKHLLLAARQVMSRASRQFCETEFLERLGNPGGTLCCGEVLAAKGKRYIFGNCRHDNLRVRVAEDKTHTTAQLRPLPCRIQTEH
jgi:hypothetical protein